MKGYLSSAISPNLSETPEGYLICHDVRLARTGFQEYRKAEIPPASQELWPELGPNDVIRAWKTKDELFHPDTIASYNGYPVTEEHPRELIDVTDHREFDCGHVLSPRAGAQAESDGEWYLYGDLMLTDPELIDKVRNGSMRQVSCGSRTTFTRRADGDAEQTDIRGNHVAVVPKGRAGPLAGIRDHDEPHTRETYRMPLTLANIFGVGLKETASKASPEELTEFVSLNLHTKPQGTMDRGLTELEQIKADIVALKAKRQGVKDADEEEGGESETAKLHKMIEDLQKQVTELTKQAGKSEAEGEKEDAPDAESEESEEATTDADDDETEEERKKREAREMGAKDGELLVPGEKKDPIVKIKAAGSMDAVMELKVMAQKSKNPAIIKAWNAKFRALKGEGTRDSYSEFNGAAGKRSKNQLTEDERVTKAQEAYDAARRGKK